jgi:hypothetical protein
VAWWVDVALGRDPERGRAARRFADGARMSEAWVRARLSRRDTDAARRVDVALVAQAVAGLAARADAEAIADATRREVAASWRALVDDYRRATAPAVVAAMAEVDRCLARLDRG